MEIGIVVTGLKQTLNLCFTNKIRITNRLPAVFIALLMVSPLKIEAGS